MESLKVSSWSVRTALLLLENLESGVLSDETVVYELRFDVSSFTLIFGAIDHDQKFGIRQDAFQVLNDPDFYEFSVDEGATLAINVNPETLVWDLVLLICVPFTKKDLVFSDGMWWRKTSSL